MICKLLERLIKNHLVDFLVKNNSIKVSQHEFQKARSCLINMLCFLEDITEWVVKASKGKFLYSAVSSPQDRSKGFTLYFPDRPVHSDTISASLGSIQSYATINARRLLVHTSTTVYSQVLIYSAE